MIKAIDKKEDKPLPKKLLFIGGSVNQTSMMHKISQHLDDRYKCFFTPFYSDGFLQLLTRSGFLDFTVLGGKFKKDTLDYLHRNNLEFDERGKNGDYDLVLIGSDLIIPKNIRNKPIVLVQEGMTDKENGFYHLVKWFHLPRWLAGTATMGLSDAYKKFCVASDGYRELFIRKGVKAEKIVVTGIPNFDNAAEHTHNDFPYKNYVLAITSDMRETFKYDNRKKFIKNILKIAAGRRVIFKLHPNEKYKRAIREIEKYAPGAPVFQEGNIAEMIANCDVLCTQESSAVYIGLALNKECYSYFDLEELKKMMPIQNCGASAEKIAALCEEILEQRNKAKE